jgi:SRSO17 transposase
VHSVGVQRQYTGTAGADRQRPGRGVPHLRRGAWTRPDRPRPYLPASWIEDPDRCRAAGIPDGVGSATKLALAAAMITRAVRAGTPASWVAGDEVYGGDPHLRATIRRLGLGYVMKVASNRRMPTPIGPRRVDELAANLPDTAWERRSAGKGSKGPRYYSWAWLALDAESDPDTGEVSEAGEHHLLVRRTDETGELAYHRCWTPAPTSMPALIRVAGQRWRVEENFRAAKRTRRSGPTSSATLDLLALLDHPRDAGPRLPRRRHRYRTR